MAVKILGVPKSKKGKVKEEGAPSTPSETIPDRRKRIEAAAKHTLRIHRKDHGLTEQEYNDVLEYRAGLGMRRAKVAKDFRQEKRKELKELQELGVVPDDNELKALKTEDRRREVYKLHLRGFTQQLIADALGVSRITINTDLKLMTKKLIEELTTLGAEGLVTKSFTMYELLQHETLRYLDQMNSKDIRNALPLLRLAKDIEDSKTRLLSSIGAIRPSSIKGAQSIVQGNTAGAPIVQTNDMLNVLSRIQKRFQSAGAEDAELSND